jgi:hypothetical protein
LLGCKIPIDRVARGELDLSVFYIPAKNATEIFK